MPCDPQPHGAKVARLLLVWPVLEARSRQLRQYQEAEAQLDDALKTYKSAVAASEIR